MSVGLGLGIVFVFVCVYHFESFSILAVLVLFAFFVVLDLVSCVLCQEIGWEELVRSVLCQVGRKTLTQSID